MLIFILPFDMLQGHQYERVSGFVYESFGYIPMSGESIKVVLKTANLQVDNEYTNTELHHQDQKQTHQIYKLVVRILFLPICLTVWKYTHSTCTIVWMSI